MTLVFLIPEIIVLLSFFLYSFILGTKKYKEKNELFINTYILASTVLSCLIWLIFLFFFQDLVLTSFNFVHNKLFTIFKIYILIASFYYYIKYKDDFNSLKFCLLIGTILSSFIIISYNSSLISFIGFSFLFFCLFGFFIEAKFNSNLLSIVSPLFFIAIIFLSYTGNDFLFLLIIFSVIISAYFFNNDGLHYITNAIALPSLLFFLVKSDSTYNSFFFHNLVIIGVVLVLLSTILSFSNNYKDKQTRTLFLNYFGHVLILLGLNSGSSLILAFTFIFVIPFLFSKDLLTFLTLTMNPLSPFFILKVIIFVVIFKYSIPIFILLMLSHPVLSYNTISNNTVSKFNSSTKFLYILCFFVIVILSAYYNILLEIVSRVLN